MFPFRFPSLPHSLLILCLSIGSLSLQAATLIEKNSEWRYFAGQSEPSAELGQWRLAGFDDDSWSVGEAPFRYGDGQGGTLLEGMQNVYSTFYLRKSFEVQALDEITGLELRMDYDDGFAVWINGNLVLEVNAPPLPSFNSFATAQHESGAVEAFPLPLPLNYLKEGQNLLAIQGFNVNLGSSDFVLDPEVISFQPDLIPPVVQSIDPVPGAVSDLSQVLIRFSEVVVGVEAADLWLNGVPAFQMIQEDEGFRFYFSPVTGSSAVLSWAPLHGIQDTGLPPNLFDSEVVSETRHYTLQDLTPPALLEILPPPNSVLSTLKQIQIKFTEPVEGVRAGDLRINGKAADQVTGFGAGPYVFRWSESFPDGMALVDWDRDLRIVDQASDPNRFTGQIWDYLLDANHSSGSVRINEFMVSNQSGLMDEEGEIQDWLELLNLSDASVDLGGWSLTDDPDEPRRWVFPQTILPPGEFLVVFASGKDRRLSAGTNRLHTNFKLARNGEYIGLYDLENEEVARHELSPSYPEQRNDISYGLNSLGDWRYYEVPTPGRANGESNLFSVSPKPHFNVSRGVFTSAFDLILSTEQPTTIRFTTDGSEPSATTGAIYSGPIRIGRTTILRAASFSPGSIPSKTVTHSYFFNLSNRQVDLPVLSLVTDQRHLFGPSGIMETNPRNTTGRGIAWERPVSVEWLNQEDHSGFQEEAGLRLQGGDYIRGRYDPNGGLPFSKYSFRLYFRGDYGASKLNFPVFGSDLPVKEFDQIVLRAGMNDHSNPFIVDELVRRLGLDTGHIHSHGTLVHLFLNGEYQGYYNPTERIDEDFLSSWHGDSPGWDLIAQFNEVREGDSQAWDQLKDLTINRDLSDSVAYETVLGFLDIDNFIDYLLVNIYAGMGDWPHNNWRAARPRKPNGLWRFYIWDGEWAFGNQGRSVSGNTIASELSGNSEIASMFQSLLRNAEFRMRMADRVEKHFYRGGALSDENVLFRWNELYSAMRNVLPTLSTSIRDSWIPQRRAQVLEHLKSYGLLFSDHTPQWSHLPGTLDFDTSISLQGSGQGEIYYTLNGTDPRLPEKPAGQTRILLESSATKWVLVPTVANGGANLGLAWTQRGGFNLGGWKSGINGVGYDNAADYIPLIGVSVESEMNGVQTSVFIRIPFQVDSADLIDQNYLNLLVRYDDGFVAYLNGNKVAEANAPADLAWNSAASGNHADAAAMQWVSFNISQGLQYLVEGSNILALHGLNDGLGSSDFLIDARMEIGRRESGEVNPDAILYTGPIQVKALTQIQARAWVNGEWSALIKGDFSPRQSLQPFRITEIHYHPLEGNRYEFIELRNESGLPQDLSGYRLNGVNFQFPFGSLMPPDAIWVLASAENPEEFQARYPGVEIAGWFDGSLDNGGEKVALIDSQGNVVLSVEYRDDSGWPAEADGLGHSLEWRNVPGEASDPLLWQASTRLGGSPGSLEETIEMGPIRLDEWMANNVDSVEVAGVFPDWIEILNSGTEYIDISGWSLTDGVDGPPVFVFPQDSVIASGDRWVVWCWSESALPVTFQALMGLDRDGERIVLSDSSGKRVDSVSFGPQAPGFTMAREAENWRIALPTPGTETLWAEVADAKGLRLNEWLANPFPGQPDGLEIFNPHPTNPVPLFGLTIDSNGSQDSYLNWAMIGPGDWLWFRADQRVGPNDLDLNLSASGDSLRLLSPEGELLDEVQFGAQNEGVSQGRYPDGSESLIFFPGSPTPGSANRKSEDPGLRVNEILVRDQARRGGWVEILNISGQSIALSGWGLRFGWDRKEWHFPETSVLRSGAFLKVGFDGSISVSDEEGDFQTGHDLDRRSDRVYLIDAFGGEIHGVEFGFQIPGRSIGLSGGRWQLLENTTLLAPNTSAVSLGSPQALRWNEWVSDALDGGDWVELMNTGNQIVSLEGLIVTDDASRLGLNGFRIPPLSFIDGGGYVWWLADQERRKGLHHLNFELDRSGEVLRIAQPNGSDIDRVSWGWMLTGQSLGRLPDGVGEITDLAFLTPGLSNEADPYQVDSDQDGMPDGWERDYGLDPLDKMDAIEDDDQDGMSNFAEYQSGTDPGDGGSVLAWERIEVTESGSIRLQITRRNGIAYRFWRSTEGILGVREEWGSLGAENIQETIQVMDEESGRTTGAFYWLEAYRPE